RATATASPITTPTHCSASTSSSASRRSPSSRYWTYHGRDLGRCHLAVAPAPVSTNAPPPLQNWRVSPPATSSFMAPAHRAHPNQSSDQDIPEDVKQRANDIQRL